jgi:hypothetical protein
MIKETPSDKGRGLKSHKSLNTIINVYHIENEPVVPAIYLTVFVSEQVPKVP